MSVYDFLSTRRIRGRFNHPKDFYVLTTSEEQLTVENDSQDDQVFKHAESFFEMSWNDRNSVLLLLLLYTLQGIPMGLSGSIPMIMKENGASYQSLSLFSLVSLPFSLKLLWAPLVDSLYVPAIGRRKTWLLPVQFICGFIMIYGSLHINGWILNTSHDKELSQANANKLTLFFLFLYFLMATQDIAVDGWALTMLSRQNVSYASTCNSLGQVLGLFLANQGFIVLSDPSWCLRMLGLDHPLIDLSSFMCFWGWVFIVLTCLVMIFKKEVEPDSGGEMIADGLYETYRHIVWIFQLKPVQLLTLILLTARISFGPNDAVSQFKLQEYGMAKADIATISPILFCLSLTLPAVLGRQMSCQPMTMYLSGITLKVMTSFLIWCIFQLSIVEYDSLQSPNGPSIYFFILFIVVMSMNELAGNMIFGSQTAFFAKIADPSIGGTYMTLLNTVANLGSKWPNFLALYLLPKLTHSQCTLSTSSSPPLLFNNQTNNLSSYNCPEDLLQCESSGGQCDVITDGYTIQQISCVIFGVIWIIFFYRSINQLDLTSNTDWLTSSRQEEVRRSQEKGKKD